MISGSSVGIVLIIRVHHHHDVGAGPERFAVAGLLIRAVAVVAVVNEQLQPHVARDLGGFIGAAVIHQNDQVHHLVRQIGVGHVQRFGGIVGRHDDHDFGFVRHASLSGAAVTMNW